MYCSHCGRPMSAMSEKLERYVRSQVRIKANKAYKLKQLKEVAEKDQREQESKLIHAMLDCERFIKEKYPEIKKGDITIQRRYLHYGTDAWNAYLNAKDACEQAINNEINRILAAAESGKTYDEVVELVRTLTFDVKEDSVNGK